MRQDWIEFIANGDRIAIRPEYIVMFETQAHGYTKLYVDSGVVQKEVIVSEPCEQVKQKIMGAEKRPNCNAVEHFTREEYLIIFEWAAEEHYYQSTVNQELQSSIYDKLNEILKEGDK